MVQVVVVMVVVMTVEEVMVDVMALARWPGGDGGEGRRGERCWWQRRATVKTCCGEGAIRCERSSWVKDPSAGATVASLKRRPYRDGVVMVRMGRVTGMKVVAS